MTARAAVILQAEKAPARELCTRRLASGAFDSPRLRAGKLPVFIVPTTPSTAFVKAGSAIHDDASGERLALFDPQTRARAVFLHPQFLRSAPTDVMLGAALNTFCSAVEALESNGCDPVSEAMLIHAVQLGAQYLPLAQSCAGEARDRLAVAGVLCGRGTDGPGGGLTSVLGHAIGHRLKMANGFINAIVLPHTLRFNAPVTQPSAARIARALQQMPAGGEVDMEHVAVALEDLFDKLAIPRRLRDVGLTPADFEAVAQSTLSDWFITRCARPVTDAAQVRALLEAAW